MRILTEKLRIHKASNSIWVSQDVPSQQLNGTTIVTQASTNGVIVEDGAAVLFYNTWIDLSYLGITWNQDALQEKDYRPPF